MLGISVKSNAGAIVAEIDGLTHGEQRLAMSRALNRAAEGVRTDASSKIRETYKVKKATVDKAFGVSKSSPDRLQAVVSVNGRPLSLAGFGARQTKKGVTVNVKGTRKLIPHAFIRTLTTSKGDEYEVVFLRQGKSRYPIKALKTVDVPGIFNKADLQKAIDAGAFERFETTLTQQLGYLLSKRAF